MNLFIVITVAVFFAVVMLCVIIFYIIQQKLDLKAQTQRIEKAVAFNNAGFKPDIETDPSVTSLRRDTSISSIKWLDKFLSKLLKERSKSLMVMIEQSGLKIKVSEFLLFAILIGFLGMIVVDLFFHISFVGFVILVLPFWFLQILKAKRIDAFVKQLPQALDLLSGDLRAGLDIQTGLKHLSEEFIPPLGEEFAKVVVEINLGLTITEALNNLSRRINTMDVQILCTGIIINRELGGNLSELVQNISDTVRERFRLKGMIKALTAENEMSAMLLIALPIGLFLLLNIMAPDVYGSFIKDPMGKMIIGGCIVSMIIGYTFMKKMTKVEV